MITYGLLKAKDRKEKPRAGRRNKKERKRVKIFGGKLMKKEKASPYVNRGEGCSRELSMCLRGMTQPTGRPWDSQKAGPNRSILGSGSRTPETNRRIASKIESSQSRTSVKHSRGDRGTKILPNIELAICPPSKGRNGERTSKQGSPSKS